MGGPPPAESTQGSMMQSDYVEYYHRVKEFGKMQNWDTKKVNKMLSDKAAFEKEFKLVSHKALSSKFQSYYVRISVTISN